MNLKSTIQFNCIENNDNKSYKVISPISEPGVLETQLKKYTNVTTLNIIRVDFENDCQDIYNNIDKLEDVFINLYFPLNLNKNEIKVLYNNDESLVIKNNIEIENNTFDYTLIPFYIKKENIKNNGIAEIFYQNNKIKSIYIGYSIVKLPTLINRIFRINEENKKKSIEIKFSNSISEFRNELNNESFFLWNGNQERNYEYCTIKNDYQTLICNNYDNENLYLYYENKCGKIIQLDYQIIYNIDESKIGIEKVYYILSKNDNPIKFYFYYENSKYDFPVKVYINKEQIRIVETINNIRKYFYSINQIGDYKITYLKKDNSLIEYDKIISVKKNINDIFTIIQPESQCVYYQKAVHYKIEKQKNINENYIKYYFFDSQNLTCNENDCSFYLMNNNIPETKDIYFYSIDENIMDQSSIDENYLIDNYLYKDTIIFTDVSTNKITYSSKTIILNADCLLKNLLIFNNEMKYKLNCNLLSKKQLICDIETNENLYGLYYILQNNDTISYIFFNVPIENSSFIIEPKLKTGENEIIISSKDINLESIEKIEIMDNEGETIVYSLNNNNNNKFTVNIDNYTNYISLNLIVYPDKNYTLLLYNDIGMSKLYELEREYENINIKIDNVYYNKEYFGNPIVTIEGDFSSKIEYLYFRLDNEDFSEYNKVYGNDNSENQKVFNLNLEKVGTYFLSYTLFDDNIKFNILNKKIIVGENFLDFIVFLPSGRNILLSQNYSLNIARKGNYQIKVFIGDINLQPIIYFSHKFGENNYDLYSNDMKKLTSNENYYLVIVEYETNSLLYKQDIIFSDFQFLNSYYLSLREIKILNIIDKISDLIIMNSKNNKESYYISKKDQFLFKDNKYISIIIPQEIEDEKKYGYYDVKYNNLNIAKIFISKDLINADFYYIQITGKSNLIIKSYDYYLLI